MKKRTFAAAAILGLCMTMAGAFPAFADGMKVVTLGADLSDAQKTTMMKYFNTNPDEVQILYITNADEHRHLDGIVPSWVIGTRTVSCAYVKPTTSGGIKVRTANLNWVTGNMIASTLSTSGVKNCEVIAACPFEVSGTGALTGIQMAYEVASGKKLDETKKQIATEEIVVTGNLADQVGTNQATTVVNQSKMEVIQNNVTNTSEIKNIVNNVVHENNVEINAEQVELIVALMEEISQQGYKYEDVKETLEHVNQNTTGQPAEPTATPVPPTTDVNIEINIENSDVQNQNQDASSNASSNQQSENQSSADPSVSQQTTTEQNVENQTDASTEASSGAVVVPTEFEEGEPDQTAQAAEAEPSILEQVDESVLGEDVITSSTEEPDSTAQTGADGSVSTASEGSTDASEGNAEEYNWDDYVWGDPTTAPEPPVLPSGEWEEFPETSTETNVEQTSGWTEETTGSETGSEQNAEGEAEPGVSEGAETGASGSEAASDEMTQEEIDALVAKLSEQTKSQYEKVKAFCEGEFEGNTESMYKAADETWVPAVVIYDPDVAEKVSKKIYTKYLKVLADGTGDFIPDGTEKYFSTELNVMHKFLKELFGVDQKTEETGTETETKTDILSILNQDEKESLFKETLKFFEKLYGEQTFEDVTYTEESSGTEQNAEQNAEGNGEYNAEYNAENNYSENTSSEGGETWYSEDGSENWESDDTTWETSEYVYEG